MGNSTRLGEENVCWGKIVRGGDGCRDHQTYLAGENAPGRGLVSHGEDQNRVVLDNRKDCFADGIDLGIVHHRP